MLKLKLRALSVFHVSLNSGLVGEVSIAHGNARSSVDDSVTLCHLKTVFGPHEYGFHHMNEDLREIPESETFFTPNEFREACQSLAQTYIRSGIEARWTPVKSTIAVSHEA